MTTATKLSALITSLALVFSLLSPPRANALSDDGEIALWVVGGIVLFVGAIMVGTLLTRDESKMMLVEAPPEAGEGRVAFGLDCATSDGRPAVVCW